MSNHINKLCFSYGDILIPATLVATERFSVAVAFLTQQQDDNLASGLNEQDERLLGGYRRAFGGRLNDREASRLLGCLGWVLF
jgi:hypothetical protein